MILTVWPNLDAKQFGDEIECPDWASLASTLEALAEACPGQLWSPGTYADCKRSDATCLERWAVVIDYDSDTVELHRAMRTIAAKVGHDRIIGHHTKTAGCWRMIVDTGPLDPKACRALTRELFPLVEAEPESAAISQPWYLPPKGVSVERVRPPLEAALSDPWLAAAIHLDGDLWVGYPRGGKGPDGIDRSRVDMSIVSRLLAYGCNEAEVTAVLAARGDLSSSDSARSVGRMIERTSKQKDAPEVEIFTSPEVHKTVDAALDVLARDPEIYVRGGSLVHVILSAGQGETTDATPIVASIKPSHLTERLSRGARWLSVDKDDEIKRIQPPMNIAPMILARDQWPNLRALAGIAETPIVRPDGSVYADGPWDRVSGYAYRPVGSAAYPFVQSPTVDHARAALATLREPFAEFPWGTSTAWLAAVAAIVSLVCRPAAGSNVPMFAFDAPLRGTGKTLISQCISVIATGSTANIGTFPDSPEELRKRLDGYAVMSPPLVVFDNADRPIDGGALDAALTCHGKYELRTLGATEIRRCAWSTVILATGNQMIIRGDTARRSVVARCVPRTDRPAERSGFKIPDLIGWVYAHRPRLVAAAIDLYRAYALAGFPDQGLGSRGSFEDFVARVAGAIAWAGGGNLLDLWAIERTDETETDTRRSMVEWMVARWPDGATSRQIADDLESMSPSVEHTHALAALESVDPTWREQLRDLRQPIPGSTLSQSIGVRMRQWTDIYHLGYRIVCDQSTRSTKWRVVND